MKSQKLEVRIDAADCNDAGVGFLTAWDFTSEDYVRINFRTLTELTDLQIGDTLWLTVIPMTNQSVNEYQLVSYGNQADSIATQLKKERHAGIVLKKKEVAHNAE